MPITVEKFPCVLSKIPIHKQCYTSNEVRDAHIIVSSLSDL
jgi:hypothetical protein